jgi:hypothetical protein
MLPISCQLLALYNYIIVFREKSIEAFESVKAESLDGLGNNNFFSDITLWNCFYSDMKKSRNLYK